MSGPFDPYHHWLGVSPKDQPPDHYRLVGVERFESDPGVIDSMASRHIEFLQEIHDGPHIKEAQKLLNELAAARRCLLDPERKAAYDAQLQAKLDQPLKPALVPRPPNPTVPVRPAALASTRQATVAQQAIPKRPPTRRWAKKAIAAIPRTRPRHIGRNRSVWMWNIGGTASALTLLVLGIWCFSDRDRSQRNHVALRGEPTPFTAIGANTPFSEREKIANKPIPSNQLLLWLDAGDRTTMVLDKASKISRWKDKSGNACHASVQSPDAHPQLVQDLLGNRPAVRFAGSQWLEIPKKSFLFQMDSEFTLLFVARGLRGTLLSKGTGDTKTSFALSSGVASFRAAGRNWDARDSDPSRFQVRSIVADRHNLRWYLDGALVGTYPNTDHAIKDTSRLRIGCFLRRGQGPESLFEGDLAELIIYDRSLPENERKSAESYLRQKWL